MLLVEDNTDDVRLLHEVLEERSSPFVFESVPTLAAAIERVRRGGIDLILTDLRLPDSAEGETVATLRAAAPRIPIVVLSGLHSESFAMRNVEQGAQDYLVKGRFDHSVLVRTLSYALERNRWQEELQRAHDQLEQRVAERTAELAETAAQLQTALVQLKQAQQQVVQQERLRALGQMASGIAHDFNNALAPIIGYADLLLHSRRLTPERRTDYLRIIHTAARDSSSVVSRLREFFRYRDEHDVFGPVKLGDLARQVMALTRPRWKDQALGRGVDIRFALELERVPTVLGSESELREMLVNLIFNAVDAIGTEGGVITCRTFTADGAAVIQVSDTGCGMPEDVRLRCFEPFFTTKDEQLGSGLGLAMAHGIVRRHEGQIQMESLPNKGSTVTVTLVAYDDARLPEALDTPAPALTPMRVLIVDDQPSVREVLTMCLKEDGHLVESAVDGLSALEKVRSAPWDIVLTDRAMPKMNGDQLAQEIRKLQPGIPVVLVTGFADLMRDVGDQPSAIDAVVRKPFTLQTLREGMTKAIALQQELHEGTVRAPEARLNVGGSVLNATFEDRSGHLAD